MSPDDVTALVVVDRAQRARARYGAYTSTHEALGVITEEYHELMSAIQANRLGSVEDEALDLAACALKLARDCSNEAFRERSGK